MSEQLANEIAAWVAQQQGAPKLFLATGIKALIDRATPALPVDVAGLIKEARVMPKSFHSPDNVAPILSDEAPMPRQESESASSVALDGDTRRACNTPYCEKGYQHQGECTPLQARCNAMETGEIAERIVDRLFLNGDGQIAKGLILECEHGGTWRKGDAQSQTAAILAKALPSCLQCDYCAWTISAETGEVLYCAVCDARSRANDFATERNEARAELTKVTDERDALRNALQDIDAHATPIGLVDPNDPEGNPVYYTVTVGALHRALGKSGTAPKCTDAVELAALRLAAEPVADIIRRLQKLNVAHVLIEAQNEYGRIVFGDVLTVQTCNALLAAAEPREGG